MKKADQYSLDERLKTYIKQSRFLPQASRALPFLGVAPLVALSHHSAVAQCNNIDFLTPPGGIAYSMDFDGDGAADFRFDPGGFVFFTVYNRPDCGVAVPSGNPYTQFSSGPNPMNLNANDNLPAQFFLQATNSNIPNSNYMLGVLVGGGGTEWASPSSGYIGVRCDADGDGNFNYGFIYLEIDASGNVTVDPLRSGLSPTDNNMGVVGDCASIAGPALPVEFVNIDAEAMDKVIQLSWQTVSEVDNYGFEVERSENGQAFRKISWIDGNGTTSETQSYALVDQDVKSDQVYYYRLKQLDFDGTFTYSEVVSATMIDGDMAYVGNISPNPASSTQRTYMEVRLAEAQEAKLNIYNMSGQMMQEWMASLEKGNNYVYLRTGSLVAGTYFVKTSVGNTVEYRKLILR